MADDVGADGMNTGHRSRYSVSLVVMLFLAGCATSPPEQVDDVCDIFREKSGWYSDEESRAR